MAPTMNPQLILTCSAVGLPVQTTKSNINTVSETLSNIIPCQITVGAKSHRSHRNMGIGTQKKFVLKHFSRLDTFKGFPNFLHTSRHI